MLTFKVVMLGRVNSMQKADNKRRERAGILKVSGHLKPLPNHYGKLKGQWMAQAQWEWIIIMRQLT
jgi:hypothetical protein